MDLDDRPPASASSRSSSSTRPSSATCCRSRGAEHVVGAETIAQTGEPQAQPREAEAALRAELHLHVRLRAPRRRRAPRHSDARRSTSTTARRSRTACGSRCTAARSTARRAAGSSTGLYETACRAPRAACGPTAACSTATVRRQRRPRPHAVQLARQRLPRSQHPRSAAPLDAAQALQDAKRVSLGFLHWLQTEAPPGRSPRRAGAAPAPRRHGHAPTACRSIPTSASRAASGR